MSNDKNVERVAATKIAILFEGGKCIHSRQCVLSRPDVFVPNVVGEWIHPERATAEEVVELAHACPSGAIRYERLDGGPEEQAPRVNVARIRENGPYAFTARLTLTGAAQSPGMRATLCRCGASKTKPFCDGSHTAAKFEATGEPAPGELADLPARDGELIVEPTPNGPLHVTGNLEICVGTGHALARTTETWLCRCGHSATKPFCDGTHETIGFEAP